MIEPGEGGNHLEPFPKPVLIVIAAALLAVAVWYVRDAYFNEKLIDVAIVNDGIAVTKEFDVKTTTEGQNSWTKGTIFVWGDQGKAERMCIVASYEIDPNDFAGLTVYIPQKWYIANILNSTREGQKTPLEPTTSGGGNTIDEWRIWVEVGASHGRPPLGGGSGTLVIDLVADRKAVLRSETYNVMVSVGSSLQNGIKSIGVGYLKIPISVPDFGNIPEKSNVK